MWFSADSTNASGVGSPYLSRILFSREPAFTPILIEVSFCLAAFITSFTFSALPIFPGFILKQATPASAASIALK